MRRLLLFAALIAATGLFRRTPSGGTTPSGTDPTTGPSRPHGTGGPAPAGVTSLFGSYQLAIEAAKPKSVTSTGPSGLTVGSPSGGGYPGTGPTGGIFGRVHLEVKRLEEPEWEPGSGEPCPPNLAITPAYTPPDLWVSEVNGPGMSTPGRNNNCVDCSRAFESTWRGKPVMAAAMADPNASGTTALRITEWAEGASFREGTYSEMETNLNYLGNQSSAIIVSEWSVGGGGHAFNVINDDGEIMFVDSQSATVSGWPPISWSEADVRSSWAVYFDSNGNPV